MNPDLVEMKTQGAVAYRQRGQVPILRQEHILCVQGTVGWLVRKSEESEEVGKNTGDEVTEGQCPIL